MEGRANTSSESGAASYLVWRSLALVFALLVLGAMLVDGGAFLGTDTGGKVATLEAMTERGDWSLDVGYWAEEWDPDGRFHPLYGTTRTDAGWVQVTSIPMILLARPLYAVGGYRLALVLPMIGTVLAALAAAALAQRLADAAAARRALVVAALGSPLAVYALDLWEHSLGVACMAWAAVFAFDVAEMRRSPLWGAATGALLALGATMRQEALVYALTVVGAACLALLVRRRISLGVLCGVVAVSGFLAVWWANHLVEGASGAVARTARASGAVSGATGGLVKDGGGSELLDRVREGLRTTFATSSIDSWAAIGLGLAVTLLIALVALRSRSVDAERARVAALALVLPVLAVTITGIGFVPGLFAAYPVAAAAFAIRGQQRSLWVLAVALISLPIVWSVQYLGGAGPQWGGRYVLMSGFLLGVVGVVAMSGTTVPPIVRNALFGASFAVSAVGVGWLIQRSHEVADFYGKVIAVQEQALIGRNQFALREVGQRSLHQRWLSAPRNGDLEGPVQVLRSADVERFSVLQRREAPSPELRGVTAMGRDEFEIFGQTFDVLHYQFSH